MVDTDAELRENWGTQITGLLLPRGAIKRMLPLIDAGCESALILDRDTLLWALGNGYIYTVKRQQARPGGGPNRSNTLGPILDEREFAAAPIAGAVIERGS